MTVILLHGNHRKVSTSHVAIFRVTRSRIKIQLQCVKITPVKNYMMNKVYKLLNTQLYYSFVTLLIYMHFINY